MLTSTPIRISLMACLAFGAALANAGDQAHLSAAPFEDRSLRLQASVLSLYGTASDYRRTLDFRAALEWPLSDRSSVLGGLRRNRHDAKGAEGPDSYRESGWGIEAAFRRHPWEWMPGFFIQALAAMERSEARNPAHDPDAQVWWPNNMAYGYDATLTHRVRIVYEGGLGYGYAWSLGRLSMEWQGILGPRAWSETAYATRAQSDGSRARFRQWAGDWDSFFRFRDLRIGVRF